MALHSNPTGDQRHAQPAISFEAALGDAERLLHYAAEVGVDVDPETRAAVLRARSTICDGWSDEIAANLLAALTKLAARLKPVTAESLKAFHDDTRLTVHSYLKIAIWLACIIIPVSVATFVTSAVSTAIVADITKANALAVKLRSELGPPGCAPEPAPVLSTVPGTGAGVRRGAATTAPNGSTVDGSGTAASGSAADAGAAVPAASSPTAGASAPVVAPSATAAGRASGAQKAPAPGASAPVPDLLLKPCANPKPIPEGINTYDVISDLQEYASTVRLINARARKLNWFVLHVEHLPQEDVGAWAERKDLFELPVGISDTIFARDTITNTYQDVRYFAQAILADITVVYGAITSCILPVLYALLGTCAYLLRTFEDQMSSRTFTPSAANSARFLIAAIGGAVVGLFNNFAVTPDASIPPLAIAFLVGYAVDVFFAFLEGLLKAFTKTAPAPNPPPAPHA